ncbi:unnamed protein product [Choristocarpus tenellus]
MALDEELKVIFLLTIVWFTEQGCKRINASPIIGQIIAGMIVGPALLDVIPYTDAFRLLGKIGVMILVTESGLSVDLSEVREVGVRAFFAATTGVIFPVLLSFIFYSGLLGAGWKTTLAVGAALAPTSLGFSAQMLGEVGELKSLSGQLICTAAVVDDVISLLLLAEVQALGNDNPKWHDYALPVAGSVGSVVVGIITTVLISGQSQALRVWLSSLDVKENCLTSTRPTPSPCRPGAPYNPLTLGDKGKTQDTVASSLSGSTATVRAEGKSRGDYVLLVMVLSLSTLMAYLSALVGSSDLLGCFLGGVAFSRVPGVQTAWARQLKRFSLWGVRLFFSATVAFSIPSLVDSGGLLQLESVWRGLVLTVAAVGGKMMVGLFAIPLTPLGFATLGWAMNGRGEFSFLIAQEASEEGILEARDYSAVVWALLLSSVSAPIAFRRALAAAGAGAFSASTRAGCNCEPDGVSVVDGRAQGERMPGDVEESVHKEWGELERYPEVGDDHGA